MSGEVMERTQEQDQDAYAQSASVVFAGGDAPNVEMGALGAIFVGEFARAEADRMQTEERWLRNLRQYRGKYDADTLAKIGPRRSKSFVRKTRVKVKTVDARISDLQFPAGNEKNWTVDTTPVPSISPEIRKAIEAQLMQASGGQKPPKEVIDAAVIELAKKSSNEMTKVIEDQLVEARYKESALKAIHSGNLYGTGILKGPLVERKIRMRYEQKGEQWVAKSETYAVPFVEYVPLWRWYPDMSGTDLDSILFVWERHKLTKAQFSNLAKRKTFKKDVIIDHIKANPKGMVKPRWFENELQSLGDRDSKQADQATGHYEVLERWGWVDGCDLAQLGINVPAARHHESFFSNVWMLPDGTIIKAVLQPINGVTWPYHLYQFDKDETSIFGEGLASIMEHDQEMLNAAIRLMLDHAAISAGPMVEIDVSLITNVQDADQIGPWKVYYRNGKEPGSPAVRFIQVPTEALEDLHRLAQMFEQNTDEVTAIPRYMSGEAAGAPDTAQATSMLMGAANIVIKDLITSWDEGVTRPFITGLYRWNMQFSKNNAIKGDFDVKARGTASLVAREIRARSLNEFATLVSDPQDAPFIKRHDLLIQRAEALELSNVVKTKDEVAEESRTPEAQKVKKLQDELREAQVREIQGKASKLMADAEVAKQKVDEMLANIQHIIAKTVETKVETIFAALQAGGAATRDPVTAPAGDAILRDAGYKEKDPNPSTAQLNGPPVQADAATMRLMGRGQTFAAEPRGGQMQPQGPASVDSASPNPATPGPTPGAVEMPDANTGQRAGIETTRIES